MKPLKLMPALALGICATGGVLAADPDDGRRMIGPHRIARTTSSGGFGMISNVAVEGTGAISFAIVGAKRTQLPQCATVNPDRWIIDATEGSITTALLWAADHHRRVQVSGTGNCPGSVDIESVSRIVIQDELGGGQ